MPESCQLSHKSDRTFSSEPGEGLRVTHDCLDVGHELVKVDECQLSLHVGILAQMASGVAKCTGLTTIKETLVDRRTCFLHGNSPECRRHPPKMEDMFPGITESSG